MLTSIMTPVLALILWTFVLFFWMYATRLPAMRAAGLNARTLKRKDDLNVLPTAVKQVADNYNHLHEQPTIFYALMTYSHLVGVADSLNLALAWGYVATRVAHSVVQATFNYVPLRFVLFAASELALIVIATRNVLALFA